MALILYPIGIVEKIEPIDFLDLYMSGFPSQKGLHKKQHGWRGAAEDYLAQTLGVAKSTVHKWGAEFENRPDWVPLALGAQHALRKIAEIAAKNTLPKIDQNGLD